MKQDENEYSAIMAIFDFLPVIAFAVAGVLAYMHILNVLLLIGVIITLFAGLVKASWKTIMALKNKDYKILTKLFHICLPLGFVIMMVSIPFSLEAYGSLIKGLFNMPSVIFTSIGLLLMCLMFVFAFTLDSKKAKSNWIEQTTNTVAQIFFVIALLLI